MQVLERLKETMVSQLNPLMETTDGVLPEDINAQIGRASCIKRV